jgi:hypothetical protein
VPFRTSTHRSRVTACLRLATDSRFGMSVQFGTEVRGARCYCPTVPQSTRCPRCFKSGRIVEQASTDQPIRWFECRICAHIWYQFPTRILGPHEQDPPSSID